MTTRPMRYSELEYTFLSLFFVEYLLLLLLFLFFLNGCHPVVNAVYPKFNSDLHS